MPDDRNAPASQMGTYLRVPGGILLRVSVGPAEHNQTNRAPRLPTPAKGSRFAHVGSSGGERTVGAVSPLLATHIAVPAARNGFPARSGGRQAGIRYRYTPG